MAGDKFQGQLNAKIDAILEKLGIKPEDIKQPEKEPEEVDEAARQAESNAPKTPAAQLPPVEATGVENAPATPPADTSIASTYDPDAPSVPRRRG